MVFIVRLRKDISNHVKSTANKPCLVHYGGTGCYGAGEARAEDRQPRGKRGRGWEGRGVKLEQRLM